MSTDSESVINRYRRAEALTEAVDERLEAALKQREPLERVMPDLLTILTDLVGAAGAACQTFDESLSERTFHHGKVKLTPALFELAADGADEVDLGGDGVVHVRPLDVAGDDFGRIYAFFEVAPSDEAKHLIHLFSEELDNHLAAIAAARRKYEVIRAISDALKEPALDRGIAHAIEILHRHVNFDSLVLLFRHEDDLEHGALRYQIYDDGALRYDSATLHDEEVDALVRRCAPAFFDGDDDEIRERFKITRYREELLITGVRAARVVGRMLATSSQGEFQIYDRELLERFADYLRQRIVDFNREWKHVNAMFSNRATERLLREEGYVQRYLKPREQEIAILYADISGFTHVSEQVLRRPEAIGRLIDTWSADCVDVLWDVGGVFDKMVGDCIIGLFGPPFFELSPKEMCERALEAACRIRDLTRRLTQHEELPELAALEAPLDVSVGLNFCPVSVGLFGPNENYTAFSSGMNNAARLQGLAHAGQILCMEAFVEALDEPAKFGEAELAEVKNVRDPLRFRALVP